MAKVCKKFFILIHNDRYSNEYQIIDNSRLVKNYTLSEVKQCPVVDVKYEDTFEDVHLIAATEERGDLLKNYDIFIKRFKEKFYCKSGSPSSSESSTTQSIISRDFIDSRLILTPTPSPRPEQCLENIDDAIYQVEQIENIEDIRSLGVSLLQHIRNLVESGKVDAVDIDEIVEPFVKKSRSFKKRNSTSNFDRPPTKKLKHESKTVESYPSGQLTHFHPDYNHFNVILEKNIVYFGENQTKLSRSQFEAINWESYKTATRHLLVEVFTKEILATHSLTGKKNSTALSPAKPQLEPMKVADIVEIISYQFQCGKALVRNMITVKCADENKMLKKKIQQER